jgi:hypothetical protein
VPPDNDNNKPPRIPALPVITVFNGSWELALAVDLDVDVAGQNQPRKETVRNLPSSGSQAPPTPHFPSNQRAAYRRPQHPYWQHIYSPGHLPTVGQSPQTSDVDGARLQALAGGDFVLGWLRIVS